MGKLTEKGREKYFWFIKLLLVMFQTLKDLSTLEKLPKCFPALPPLFSCISSKIYGEPKNKGATSWHCCLLFASYFRAQLVDMVHKIPSAAGSGST